MPALAFLTGNLWRASTLALLIALGVLYAGYSHRGGKIEDMRNGIATVKAQLAVSNAAVSAMEAEAHRKAATAEKALREAERANAGLRGDIARIGARKVKGCETGSEVMGSGL